MNPLSKTTIRDNGRAVKREVPHDARVKTLLLLTLVCSACTGRDERPSSLPSPAPTAIAQNTPNNGSNTKAAFEKIYRDADWGTNDKGVGNSGTGSTVAATDLYRRYLETFMKDHNIKSVVDAGCGDWEFSQKIDWTGIDYKGYDIVAAVVEGNKQKHAKPNVQFFVGNIVEDDLPAADLLVSKHVLQHIPNGDVQKFLHKQLKKYKHVILTNGVNAINLSGANTDIQPGGYRELDITRPPFNVRGMKELTFWANDFMHQVVHVDNSKK
jgi:SAM-dependent methyltransferase